MQGSATNKSEPLKENLRCCITAVRREGAARMSWAAFLEISIAFYLLGFFFAGATLLL